MRDRKPSTCPAGEIKRDDRSRTQSYENENKNNFFSGSFKCHSSSSCISTSKVCNGVNDCLGGDDEMGCNTKCNQDHKRNVFVSQFKSGDVSDLSDTKNCPSTSFQCRDGSRCLPGYELCNAVISCPDGSDELEALCSSNPFKARNSKSCPFRCANGNCRALDVMCSGSDGCGDNSDEQDCQICSELVEFGVVILQEKLAN